MKRVLINGVNSKAGGGKSILNNYLSLLKQAPDGNMYFVTCPDEADYLHYNCAHIQVVPTPNILKNSLLFVVLYFIWLPNKIKKLNINAVFNHGDIPIATKCDQVYLFDWPYAVYPKSVVWQMMDIKSWLTRKLKLFIFKRTIHFPKKVIAQNPTMKSWLEKLYQLKGINIVPNAVSLDNFSGGTYFNFELPKGKVKCLYLTHYYPHKNLEIFLPLALKIKAEDLPFVIVVTIKNEQHKNAKAFLDTIQAEALTDIIINVGPVSMQHVPSLYQQCDALLMPTLLESFSGTYVEAMYHGIPIFTSNLDFAEDVCGDSAFYFEPMDDKSILDTLKKVNDNPVLRTEKITRGKERLSTLIGWEKAFTMYQDILLN